MGSRRWTAFAERLREAATAKGMPARYNGAVAWLAFGLNTKFGLNVNDETARRWLAGDRMPTRENLHMIAELLDVAPAWLLGNDNAPAAGRAVSDMPGSGIVDIVAGFIRLDGGQVSFPGENDVFAKEHGVHLNAIICGIMHRIHVTLGIRSGKMLTFRVPPRRADGVIVLGAIRYGLSVELFRIPDHVRSTRSRVARGTAEQFIQVRDFEDKIG